MRDPRIPALVRAIEARFPGTRVEIDPFRDPDGDRTHRWMLEVLFVREKDMGKEGVEDFAYRLASALYGGHLLPCYIEANGAKDSRRYLARKEAREAAERSPARPRATGPSRARRSRRPTRVGSSKR